MHLLRLMLVGVWLGLLWASFHFFDHHVQSSVARLQADSGTEQMAVFDYTGLRLCAKCDERWH